MDSIPGLERCPGGGHGYPLQYSFLENPMDGGAWRAIVHGVTKSQTRLKCVSMHSPTGHIDYFCYQSNVAIDILVFIFCLCLCQSFSFSLIAKVEDKFLVTMKEHSLCHQKFQLFFTTVVSVLTPATVLIITYVLSLTSGRKWCVWAVLWSLSAVSSVHSFLASLLSFVLLTCLNSLCILDINTLSVTYVVNFNFKYSFISGLKLRYLWLYLLSV